MGIKIFGVASYLLFSWLVKCFARLSPTVSVEVKTDEYLENPALLVGEIFSYSSIYFCLILQVFDPIFSSGTT